MRKLYIIGFPGLYGGAGTELHHQIKAWLKIPELELCIIPTNAGYAGEPLYQEMVESGIQIHNHREYDIITEDDAVINFCSEEFLVDLPLIHKMTKRIAWVNCMTFMFQKEKDQAEKGYISHYLYQREEVMIDHNYRMNILSRPKCETMVFKPYFDPSTIEYNCEPKEKTNIGRISRCDLDKFHKDTLHIYEYIVSPKMKQGHFLGFSDKVPSKIGKPFDWIKTYANQNILPVKNFYKSVDFIVQPTDTMENLPRIGFEAMHSGVPLVVDNRGGWKHLVEHGITGFLCNTTNEFIYYGSRLAFDEDLRGDMAFRASERVKELSSLEQSLESWGEVFESLFN